jgi:hypothetical protein
MPCQNTPYSGTTWLQKAPAQAYNTQVSNKSDERAWMDNSSANIDGPFEDMIAAMGSLSLTRAQPHSSAAPIKVRCGRHHVGEVAVMHGKKDSKESLRVLRPACSHAASEACEVPETYSTARPVGTLSSDAWKVVGGDIARREARKAAPHDDDAAMGSALILLSPSELLRTGFDEAWQEHRPTGKACLNRYNTVEHGPSQSYSTYRTSQV